MSHTQWFRNLVFTVNNCTEEDFNRLQHHQMFKYVIIGKEISESGTPHLQGYAELKKQIAFSTVKKEIHPTMHHWQLILNVAYCAS